MFLGIDTSTFDDPEIKEDSVRELVIAPILARLGYGPSGTVRVARSKSLKNPFIRVGTRNHPITTIPDYTIYVDDKPVFVLDAKAPTQDVLGSDHIQQAYSYAIHPEIRCEEFGLCNGRKFVAFSVAQEDPLIDIDFNEIEERWEELEKLLLPKYLKEPTIRDFKPDFGSALKKLGYDSNTALVMLKVKLDLFGRVNDELYTASANFNLETEEYCVSFDFNPQILPQLVAGLPDYLAEVFCQALTRAPYQASAAEAIELDLTVRLGNETSGQWEKFIPLIIEEIHESRFNPEKTNNASDDTPPYVFKLRDAFVVTNSENNI